MSGFIVRQLGPAALVLVISSGCEGEIVAAPVAGGVAPVPMAAAPDAGTPGPAAPAGAPPPSGPGTDQGAPAVADAGAADGGGNGDADGGAPAEPGASGPVRFVGVGSFGRRGYTDDGKTWEDIDNGGSGDDHTPDLLRNVAFGNGRFVAVGGDANSMIMVSEDGRSWDEDKHPDGGVWMGGVVHADGVWIAAGGSGVVLRSTDNGETWTQSPDWLNFNVRDLAAGEGVVIAVGDGGQVARSTDAGITFDVSSPGDGRLDDVAHGQGTFIALGSEWNGGGFDAECILSRDQGVTWEACPFDGDFMADVIAVPGALVVSMGDAYAESTDGVSFSVIDAQVPDRIAFGDGRWVGSSDGRRHTGATLDSLSVVDGSGFRALVAGRLE